MKLSHLMLIAVVVCVALAAGTSAHAAVSAEQAQELKTTLTPLGGEKAGNADGTIPAWNGGYTTPIPGYKNGDRRTAIFADEKPLFSITPKNMDQYAGKLTDGVKGLLKKYPDSFRLDVYPTHRTGAAPQWVYDNTFDNATRATLDGDIPKGCFGGIPFPIPQSGGEVMWNHLLRWRGASWLYEMEAYQLTPNGKRVMTTRAVGDQQMPYYFEEGSVEKWNGEYWLLRMINSGPPLRAGEAITGRENVNYDKSQVWVYLTGQRRTRKLPQACCDTPTPAAAGLAGFDEIEVWTGRITRFDWKILGKKEMYIPYNGNQFYAPTSNDEIIFAHHLNPDHFRWELHRVWVVEATLRKGNRHQAPKSLFYIDEDTWNAVLGDRWDASGRLWKTVYGLPIVMPDIPSTVIRPFGFYDLISGASWHATIEAETKRHWMVPSRYPDRTFTPDAMTGRGAR